jgi:hypothetical protein
VCCGSLPEFEGWLDKLQAAADFDGVMLDNLGIHCLP